MTENYSNISLRTDVWTSYPVLTLSPAFLYVTGNIAAPADIIMIEKIEARRLNANVVRLNVKPRFSVVVPKALKDCRDV